jgi:amino acid adenylation domain-containing protein/thioester reductase-like protein
MEIIVQFSQGALDAHPDLSAAKRALLEQWRRGGFVAEQIPRRRDRGPVPLSSAQQRLWFLEQVVPGTAVHNLCSAVRLRGRLDVAALSNSLAEILRRHEALRTTYVVIDEQPMQVVVPGAPFAIPVTEVTGISEVQQAQIDRQIAEEARTPFDLTRAPLLRCRLLRLGDDEHVFVLTLHHIAADGWSLGVLLRELTVLYLAFSAGRRSPLPELPIQYSDFSEWQRQRMQGELLENELRYWRSQLGDEHPAPDLPTDRPRTRHTTFAGARHDFALPLSLTNGITALGKRGNATLFMTLLAAFFVLLHRYTGQQDIRVGSPIANRNRQEIEPLIGFFVNMLVLRVQISRELSFWTVLDRVRETSLGGYAHQDVPFEKLVEELRPDRRLDHSPLFQVAFVLQNAPSPLAAVPGLAVTLVAPPSATSNFDVTLSMTETDEGLRGHIEYSTDLFDPPTIARMSEHLQVLLQGILESPDMPVGDLPILPDAERSLIASLSRSRQRQSDEIPLHRRFEQQAARVPGSTAVVFEGRSMTYAELNERANALGVRLQKLGVRPDVLAGICLDRSPELIIAMIAVLKAGGAYLPLDPGYPGERIRFMTEDAGAEILITDERHSAMLQRRGARVLLLNRHADDPSARRRDNLNAEVSPGNLAYVIYTSGSTGRPKGVMITHANIARLFSATVEHFGFRESDIWTLFHSCAFDFSVWEIWGALLHGGRLVVISYELSRSPESFYDLVCSERVTVLNQTPSSFAQLMRVDAVRGSAMSLRLVVFGGEALDPRILKPWFDRHGDTQPRLVNMYGITETTVHVTCRVLSAADADRPSRSVIGHPLTDLDLFLLDSRRQPVPIGICGEAYVGGAGIGRGYLRQPSLTGLRFVPLPWSDEPGVRFYRTGDLMRRRADGDLEFLGRIDHQVKIRGFRIEPGEIEAALLECPEVGSAVVTELDDPALGNRLVAYVTPGVTAADDRGVDHTAGRVLQWQSVFDEVYRQPAPVAEPSFNIAGWTSSYTSQLIPADEMRDWVHHTVQQILAFRPRVVLEIGCGTGLLLLRVAPHCEKYIGTDVSNVALQDLEPQASSLSSVTLLQRPADAPAPNNLGPVDLVIINSVAQYFPAIEYLTRVIEHAVSATREGGTVFVGDVRSLPLLRAFHKSVTLYKAVSPLTPEETEALVERAVFDEPELVVDPAFFFALQRRLPRIGSVHVRLKRGRHWNEMNRFRYDVVLHVGLAPLGAGPVTSLEWSERTSTFEQLRHLLSTSGPGAVLVRGVPNARLRGALDGVEPEAMDPHEFWALEDEYPYAVEVRWSGPGLEGYYDVIAIQRDLLDAAPPGRIFLGTEDRPLADAGALVEWQAYSNRPAAMASAGSVAAELRSFLKNRLPDYMLPSLFVQMQSLPLTPNGKIDRKALPRPHRTPRNLSGMPAPPRTPLERKLVDIWAEIVGVHDIGVHDSFFDLGGHSILATQLIYRIRHVLRVDVPLRVLFERPTVAWMARVIEERQQSDRLDTMAKTDFRAECVLDPTIRRPLPVAAAPLLYPRAVLLTGATGFLGAFLLRELLNRSDAQVHCLIRANSIHDARLRLFANLASLRIKAEHFAARIVPVLGDLAYPLLGLPLAEFNALADTVERIYHSASTVNFVRPYAELKRDNVLGVQEILRLASRGKSKRVHLVSTLHVFSAQEAASRGVLREHDLPDDPEGLALGYTQSKWVAERLATEARSRGIAVDIYRPGRIWGESRSGACQTRDFLWLLLKASIEAGVAPEINAPVNVIPVDYASKAIVHLSLGTLGPGETFHLVNGRCCDWTEILSVLHNWGYALDRVPYAGWCNAIHRHSRAQPSSAAGALALLLDGMMADGTLDTVAIDCESAIAGLSGSGISCPPIDRNLLSTYVSYFVDNKFFPLVVP